LRESGKWEQDKYGNFKWDTGTKVYRMKFQEISVRLEVQVVHAATQYSGESKSWVKLAGEYFKDLKVNPETGKINVGKYLF
jgi:hypothetical protein